MAIPIADSGGSSLAPCNPGEFRAPGEASCQYCPSGYHSSAGQTACDQCPPGTESVLSVSFTYFHLWNKGLSTNCSYNCGTPYVSPWQTSSKVARANTRGN